MWQKSQVRFCEGAHSNLGAITPTRGVLWALLDNIYYISTKKICNNESFIFMKVVL